MSSKIAISAYLSIMLYPFLSVAADCQQDSDYEYARQLRTQQYFAEAEPVLKAVIARDPRCMEGKMELALTHFSLEEYDQAEILFLEIRSAVASIPDSFAAAKVLETIDSHLGKLPQLRLEKQSRMSAPAVQQQELLSPPVQVALALGISDNVNGGVHFDALTFDVGGSTFTKVLDDESKAHAGSFVDLEASYQHDLPSVTGLNGTVGLMTAIRDNHLGSDFDLGTLRGGVELKPRKLAENVQLSFVLSGGSFFLAGDHYRQDVAVGAQIHPQVFDRKLNLSYQLTDSDYKTVAHTDARFHKVNLSVPLLPTEANHKLDIGVDVGYQWPESAERLADYRETSARLRLAMEPKAGHSLSASYGLSQQNDATAYNTLAFGNKKRDLKQQVLDIGWAWPTSNGLTYEANVQARNTSSDIKLFENSSLEVTAGARWELD